MTLDEAIITVNLVLVHADGGCKTCVNHLLERFEEMFPFKIERRESYYDIMEDWDHSSWLKVEEVK